MFAIFANGNLLLVFGIFAHNSYTKSYQQLAIEFKSTAVGSHVSNLFFIAFYHMEVFVTCNECSLMMTIERNGCKKGAFLLHILILSIEAGASKYYVSIFLLNPDATAIVKRTTFGLFMKQNRDISIA